MSKTNTSFFTLHPQFFNLSWVDIFWGRGIEPRTFQEDSFYPASHICYYAEKIYSIYRLEAGKFDNNLLQSIRSARNFVLVLTPGALDRCMNDDDQRDWIHKEVVCALNSHCNIIPVFDNFVMPEPSSLPKTMQALTSYNGVKWIHDYQDACVDKIDRFIRGDAAVTSIMDRFLNATMTGTGSQSGTSSISGRDTTVSGGNGNYNNRQNAYQRTISNDSTKPPSSSSDDPANNSEKE